MSFHAKQKHPFLQLQLWTTVLQGWASFYDFNFSDLRSGADVVIANSGGSQPHWKKLRGLLENAIYGGRIDSAHDIQVVKLVPNPWLH